MLVAVVVPAGHTPSDHQQVVTGKHAWGTGHMGYCCRTELEAINHWTLTRVPCIGLRSTALSNLVASMANIAHC